MKNKNSWDNLTSLEIGNLAKLDPIVIIPIGSIEQHGPHLPVGTDTIVAVEVAQRVAVKLNTLNKACVVAPAVTVANSKHHMHFAGSMTLTPSDFYNVLHAYINSITTHGFKKILLLNGHGGNTAPISTSLIMLNETFGFPIMNCGYWVAASKVMKETLTAQSGMIHACEAETSLMLAIDESLVDPIYKTLVCKEKNSGVRAFAEGFINTFHFIEEETDSGAIGYPNAATAQKGRIILEKTSDIIAELLADEELWEHRP